MRGNIKMTAYISIVALGALIAVYLIGVAAQQAKKDLAETRIYLEISRAYIEYQVTLHSATLLYQFLQDHTAADLALVSREITPLGVQSNILILGDKNSLERGLIQLSSVQNATLTGTRDYFLLSIGDRELEFIFNETDLIIMTSNLKGKEYFPEVYSRFQSYLIQ